MVEEEKALAEDMSAEEEDVEVPRSRLARNAAMVREEERQEETFVLR